MAYMHRNNHYYNLQQTHFLPGAGAAAGAGLGRNLGLRPNSRDLNTEYPPADSDLYPSDLEDMEDLRAVIIALVHTRRLLRALYRGLPTSLWRFLTRIVLPIAIVVGTFFYRDTDAFRIALLTLLLTTLILLFFPFSPYPSSNINPSNNTTTTTDSNNTVREIAKYYLLLTLFPPHKLTLPPSLQSHPGSHDTPLWQTTLAALQNRHSEPIRGFEIARLILTFSPSLLLCSLLSSHLTSRILYSFLPYLLTEIYPLTFIALWTFHLTPLFLQLTSVLLKFTLRDLYRRVILESQFAKHVWLAPTLFIGWVLMMYGLEVLPRAVRGMWDSVMIFVAERFYFSGDVARDLSWYPDYTAHSVGVRRWVDGEGVVVGSVAGREF